MLRGFNRHIHKWFVASTVQEEVDAEIDKDIEREREGERDKKCISDEICIYFQR